MSVPTSAITKTDAGLNANELDGKTTTAVTAPVDDAPEEDGDEEEDEDEESESASPSSVQVGDLPYRTPFTNPSWYTEESWANPPRTLRDHAMSKFIQTVMEKPEWYEKVHDKTIVEKWQKESKNRLTHNCFYYCIDELRYEAEQRKVNSYQASGIDGVVLADQLLDDAIKNLLLAGFASLEDVPESEKDYHPGTNKQVLDLVHPSMYCFVADTTHVTETPFTLDQTLQVIGSGSTQPLHPPSPPSLHPPVSHDINYSGSSYSSYKQRDSGYAKSSISKQFQWLPAEFKVDQSGKVTIESYINNLHPQEHQQLYTCISSIFERFIPLFERVLSHLRAPPPLRIKSNGHDNSWYVKPKPFHYPVSDVTRPDQTTTTASSSSTTNTHDASVSAEEPKPKKAKLAHTAVASQTSTSTSTTKGKKGKKKEEDMEDEAAMEQEEEEEEDEEDEEDDEDEDMDDEDRDSRTLYIPDVMQPFRPYHIPPPPEPPKPIKPTKTNKASLKWIERSRQEKFARELKAANWKPTEVNLKGRNLQAIVKLANIILTPEQPNYAGGSWHVEGMANESIVATGIQYLHSENITESRLAFREAISQPAYEQGDGRGMGAVYGYGYGYDIPHPLNQELGSVITRSDRSLVFPNIYQHRVQPFRLVDKTRPGIRKILVFFLVDPNIRVLSTSIIPPQQSHWLQMKQLTVYQQFLSVTPLIDPLIRLILEYQDLGLMTRSQADDHRTALMKERTYFVKENTTEFFEREFTLCEH